MLPGNSPKLNKRDENPPAILVSCPSVDEEPRSPTKRRHGMSTEADPISDDGKYYRIERLDPEGCDQVKRETRRKRYVDCRTIPIKAIQRRKVVSTRLTLLSRKMRNANKLNVFAGKVLFFSVKRGCILIYSCSARLNSFEIKLNIHPSPIKRCAVSPA